MNGDKVTSPRKATSPMLAPVKASAPTDDDDVLISTLPKTPAVVASPKVANVKPPPEDEDDKPLSSKTPKVASPKATIAAAKTPKLEDDKPVTSTMVTSAPAPKIPSSAAPSSAASTAAPLASSSAPTPVAAPDLQSILSKVKALAAQSAANAAAKSSRPASSETSAKRPKVPQSSDDDDDEPLSARPSSSAKAHSSSSSKHRSSHSTHDKKKREHDRSSPSRSRNSSALLGDAGSEVKSIGHVFLSSDRSIIDQLIAGILSRWWYGIEWPPQNYQPSVDKTWKPLVGFSFVYEGPDGRIHNIREAVAAATKGAATADPQKVNIGPPTHDNLKTLSKKDLKALLIRCLDNQLAALKGTDPQFHGKSLTRELNDFKTAVSAILL